MAAGRRVCSSCSWLVSLVPLLLLLLTTQAAAGMHGVQVSVANPLSLIAPGLTAANLCSSVRSQQQAAVAALAAGTAQAYDRGEQVLYAQAMASAAAAASANGCVNELFEVVNQAINRGGYKVEVVVGRFMALGSAAGASPVLVQATAVIMCQGGASAVACSKAWAQAVQIDGNGCYNLVQAFSQAKAQCGPGFATSEAKTSIWKTPLGVCNNNVPQAFTTPQWTGFPSWFQFQTPSWFQPPPGWYNPYTPSFDYGHRRMLRGQRAAVAAAGGSDRLTGGAAVLPSVAAAIEKSVAGDM